MNYIEPGSRVSEDNHDYEGLVSGSQLALVLTCSEAHAVNLDLFNEALGRTKIVSTRSGLAHLGAYNEPSKHWLITTLQEDPNIAVVVICAHYECAFLTTPQSHSPPGRQEQSELETLVRSETQALKQALSDHLDRPCPRILGSIYDPESDWLSFFDEETQLFLPANAHRF